MRTVLIMNPASGASMLATNAGTPEEHETAILAALRAHSIEPEVRYTTLVDPGRGLARQAAAEGADVVIAAGGDGTVHEVATGLVGSKSALGIIPLGTMNNLAHSLNIPETIDEACAVIVGGMLRLCARLFIVPRGIMNNLAHSLNIPETIDEACAVIDGLWNVEAM